MDPLTHILITYRFVGCEPIVLIAGIAADIPFYTTYPIWILRRGELAKALQSAVWPEAPQWMVVPHQMTHSLLILVLVMCFIRLTGRDWPRWAMSWAVHIVIDIPTHARGQWAPQILWPLSSATWNGVSWVHGAQALVRYIYRYKEHAYQKQTRTQRLEAWL